MRMGVRQVAAGEKEADARNAVSALMAAASSCPSRKIGVITPSGRSSK